MGEAIGAAYEILSQTISLVNKSVDDWNQVLPEAHEFKRDLMRFELLIDPFVPQRYKKAKNRVGATLTLVGNQSPEEQPLYPLTPPPVSDLAPESHKLEIDPEGVEIQADRHLQEMIEEIAQVIAQAGKYVQEFIDDDRRTKSCGSSVKWFFTRLFTSGDYRLYFVDKSARIRLLLGDLMLHQQIVSSASKPTIEIFEDDMSVDSYMFWSKHLGMDTVVDWIKFRDAYNMMYGTLEPMDREYMYSILCSKNDDRVTASGFILFMRKHGFPFEKDLISRTAPVKAVMTEEGRMEIAKMVMGLVNEFSSPAMKEHLVAIYTWYGPDLLKDRRKAKTEQEIKDADIALEAKAIEWANLMKSGRQCSEPSRSEEEVSAEQLDSARRAITSFYYQYMVMWRIGQVSRELFKDVDFPGKARIRDYVQLVLPLDKANFDIVIGGEAENWQSKKPKVYNFLYKMLD